VGKLLLLFTIVPLIELYLLFQIHDLISLWPTIGLVLVTGTVGAILARYEGLRILKQWRRALARGRVPEDGVMSGVLVLVGGVLLVTPGILTDTLGLLLLIPPTRRLIARWVKQFLERRVQTGQIQMMTYPSETFFSQDIPNSGWDGVHRHPTVVADAEGEIIERDDEDDTPPPNRLLH
jgi:UPF0716 protein FxsA